MKKDAGFILSMIVLAAAIAGAAYFFLISPAFAAASDARAEEEAALAFNDTLEIQLAQYKADYAKLPETREQIGVIREAFTFQEDVAAVRTIVAETLTAESLTLTTDNVGVPVLVVPGTRLLEPSAQAVGRTSYTDGLVFQNLYATTFDIEFRGQAANIVRAISRLQMHEGRYLLVSSISILRDEEANDGTYNASIQVQFFTLVDPTATIDPGTNSANVDPATGEKVPDSPLNTAPQAPAVTPSPSLTPSPSSGDDDE
jgi:hypothetical protein